MADLSVRAKSDIEGSIRDILGTSEGPNLLEPVPLDPPVLFPSWPAVGASGAIITRSLSSVIPVEALAAWGTAIIEIVVSGSMDFNLRIRKAGGGLAAGDPGGLVLQTRSTSPNHKSGRGRMWFSQVDASRQVEIVYGYTGSPTIVQNTCWVHGYFAPVTASFQEALASIVSDQTFGGAGVNLITWSQEIRDTDGFVSPGGGTPTRLDIPLGVSKVKLKANVELDAASAAPRLAVLKNGSAVPGLGHADFKTVGLGVSFISSTSVVSVAPSDYLEVAVVSDAAGDKVVAGQHTWVSLEVVGN